MFDEIRFSQRFNYDEGIVDTTFQIKLDEKEAKFTEYECPRHGDFDENNPKFKKIIEFKRKTLKKVNKTFKLSDDEIDLINNEIDRLRFTDFQSHGYRINPQIHYKIEFLKKGIIEDYININLEYKDELINFNNILESIFKFPIFDVSFLDTVITEHDYDIKRQGIYLKDTSNKLNLRCLHFGMTSGLFNFITGWSIDFDKKIFKFSGETYKLKNETIKTINNLIETYGVYNWFYPDYYEKIEETGKAAVLDGPSWKLTFDFDDDKKLIFRNSNSYPDTYPQLAFKIKEIFGLDLLKSDYPRDLDLYHYYGDSKIKNIDNSKLIKDYILSELILKFAPLIDFYIIKFPKSLNKKYEFIFEYDEIYEDELQYIKEVIISKLQKCYDELRLKYDFFVILFPIDYLTINNACTGPLCDFKMINAIQLEKSDENEIVDFALKSWKENKWDYLEFKHFCHEINELTDFYITDKPNLDPKYILSNAYRVILKENKIKIYLKKGVKNYNIVERNVATHVLIQNFDKQLNLLSQKVYTLKIKKS